MSKIIINIEKSSKISDAVIYKDKEQVSQFSGDLNQEEWSKIMKEV